MSSNNCQLNSESDRQDIKRARSDSSSFSSFQLVEVGNQDRFNTMADSDNAVMLPDSKRYTDEELANLQELKTKCDNAMRAIRELGICVATQNGGGLPTARERHRNRFGNRTFSREDFQRHILSEDQGIYMQNKLKQYVDFIDAACEDRLDDPSLPFSPRSAGVVGSPRNNLPGGNTSVFVNPNACSPQSSFNNSGPANLPRSPYLGAQRPPSHAETRRPSSIFDQGSPSIRAPKPFIA